jgi:hypothetical protein
MSNRHTLCCLGLKLPVTILNAFPGTLLRFSAIFGIQAQQRTFLNLVEVHESANSYSFN